MTPIQIALLNFTMATILVAWLRGGRPERLGAAVILIWGATSMGTPDWLHDVLVRKVPVFEFALELAVLAVIVRMAMKGDRWWPFVASATMTLGLLVYLAVAFVPGMDRRAEISAHVGLGFALDLSLLAGVAERWLAGERPIALGARWNRRTATP